MESHSRRALLKKSVAAAGAAGVVWSAPRVEGLSLRPDYAAAQSGTGDAWSITARRITGAVSGFSGVSQANAPGSASFIFMGVQSTDQGLRGDLNTNSSFGLFVNCPVDQFNVDRLSTASAAGGDVLTTTMALSPPNVELQENTLVGRIAIPGGADTNQVRVSGRITCN